MVKNMTETERCINKAYAYIRIGNLTQAQKLAEKLGNSGEVQKLKSEIAKKGKKLRDGDSSSQQEPKVIFLKEHLDAISRVKNSKTLYEMLQISRYSTDDEIKISFKKIALILHPDKNNVPGAEECFKAVKNASLLLKNLEMRRIYNSFLDKVEANLFYGHDPQRYPPKWWCDASSESIQTMKICLDSGYHCQNPDCIQHRHNMGTHEIYEDEMRMNNQHSFNPTTTILIGAGVAALFGGLTYCFLRNRRNNQSN